MNHDIPDDLFEIQDPAIDLQDILQEIRERIVARREEKGYVHQHFPVFGMPNLAEAPADMPYDTDLYTHIRLLNEAYAQIDTHAILAPSPATQLPGVGKFWQRIRGEVHNLVLFYVNRAVTQQVNINRYLVAVVNRLTALHQEQERTIQQLEAEVERLKRRNEA